MKKRHGGETATRGENLSVWSDERVQRISDGLHNSVAVETPVLHLVYRHARKRIPKRHGGEMAPAVKNISVWSDERVQGSGFRAKGSRDPLGGGSLCHRPIGFRV
jgi:hypothetical protein